jgi:hypothetical protein
MAQKGNEITHPTANVTMQAGCVSSAGHLPQFSHVGARLNPIQEVRRVTIAENRSLSRLAAF